MIRRKIAILFILLVAFNAVAQKHLAQPEMYVGVQGGAIAGMALFKPTVEQEVKSCFLGANGGLMFRYIGHKHCGLQIELNYVQKGWHEKENDYMRQMDYIELPFLAHISFGQKCRFFFNVGPQVGYLVREVKKNEPEKLVKQYGDLYGTIDWGVAGGIGFYARTKAGVYQIGTRFNFSFNSLCPSHLSDTYSMSNLMNLSLNFAWMWQVK